jgi:uncharacterized glyoxalase superfamily protein PhnB
MGDPMTVSCTAVSPVFPVRSVRAALDHYRSLGFDAHAYREKSGDEPVYGFLRWGPVEIHLSLTRDLDPEANTSACYLYVSDADALHAQWRAANAGGKLLDLEDTPYDLREFAHIDPDGNLMRIGSPLGS